MTSSTTVIYTNDKLGAVDRNAGVDINQLVMLACKKCVIKGRERERGGTSFADWK